MTLTYILSLNSKRKMCWQYINFSLFAYLHEFNVQLSVYLSSSNSTREKIYTKNAIVINHSLHLTCLSAGSAAEIKTSPTANVILYLPISLGVNMLGFLLQPYPRPGELMEIHLLQTYLGVITSLQTEQRTQLLDIFLSIQ